MMMSPTRLAMGGERIGRGCEDKPNSLLVFQMAARPDIFAGRFAPVLQDAPINSPIVLTRSRADHVTGFCHRLAEGVRGSDIWHPESVHLLLSLVQLAR